MRVKKAVTLLLAIISIFTLVACSENNNEPEYCDDKFIEAFGKGLTKRWDYTEDPDSGSGSEATRILEATEIELDILEPYSQQLFEDTKLQELAIKYINELKNGIEVAKTYSSDGIYEDWEEHQNLRTSIISDINKNYEISVGTKYEDILNELLNQGEVAIKNDTIEKEILAIVDTIQFKELPQEYESELFDYEAIVENTSEYDLFISVNIILYDEDGVNIGTQYGYSDNWKAGSKTKMEFMSEKFDKMEIELDYYEILN